MSPRPRTDRPQTLAAKAAQVGAIGTNFAVAVGGMGLVGYFLDRWLGTRPWLLLTFLLLGLVGGFYNFVRDALAAGRKATEEFRAARDGSPKPPEHPPAG